MIVLPLCLRRQFLTTKKTSAPWRQIAERLALKSLISLPPPRNGAPPRVSGLTIQEIPSQRWRRLVRRHQYQMGSGCQGNPIHEFIWDQKLSNQWGEAQTFSACCASAGKLCAKSIANRAKQKVFLLIRFLPHFGFSSAFILVTLFLFSLLLLQFYKQGTGRFHGINLDLNKILN